MQKAMVRAVPETEIGFKELENILRREFRRTPFGFDKDNGLLTVFSGQGERLSVVPINQAGELDREASGYVPLPMNSFLVADQSGSELQATQSLRGFVVCGTVVAGSVLARLIQSGEAVA